MAEQADMDSALARLEAALTVAVDALEQAEAAADEGADVKRSVEAASSAPSDNTAALETEIAELRTARAQDLAEMKALLAELEPMLETSNA